MSAVRKNAEKTAKKAGLLRLLCVRQGNRCYWCGNIMVLRAFKDRAGSVIQDPAKATIDHLVALAAGGATDDKNCVAACAGCNGQRADFNAGVVQRDMFRLKELNRSLQFSNYEKDQLLEQLRSSIVAKDVSLGQLQSGNAAKDLMIEDLQRRITDLLHDHHSCRFCRIRYHLTRLLSTLMARVGYQAALS